MNEKNKYFVKKNECPYCTYPCDSADSINHDHRPQPGHLSYCMMCGNVSQWDENMNFVKFDIDSITDIVERNRLKSLRIDIERFWEENPDKDGRRTMYLNKMDELDAAKT